MVVIVRFGVYASDFTLGSVLERGSAAVELESVVPGGGRTVPLFWVFTRDYAEFVEIIRDHEAIDAATVVESFEDHALIALEWRIGSDHLFRAIAAANAYILRARGTNGIWEFTLRFPTHDDLATFKRYCENGGIDFEVRKVYYATDADIDPWFGLTSRQRETLLLAVSQGYFDIPRTCKTAELAEQLGISGQSVTERLRRGIANLVRNTLDPAGDG